MGGSRRRLQHVDDPETAFAAANHSAGSGFWGIGYRQNHFGHFRVVLPGPGRPASVTGMGGYVERWTHIFSDGSSTDDLSGVAIMLVVISLNLIGEGLRDILDVRGQ